MDAIIRDRRTGKRYMIRAHALDFEVFRESAGKKAADGTVKGKGEWTSCRTYPVSFPDAVRRVVRMCLADPDDPTVACADADKCGKALRGVLDKRVADIVLEK